MIETKQPVLDDLREKVRRFLADPGCPTGPGPRTDWSGPADPVDQPLKCRVRVRNAVENPGL